MKVCSKCQTPKEEDAFSIRGESKQSYCRMCQSEHHSEHYQKNKGLYAQKKKDRRAALRDFVKSLKEQQGYLCVDCGQVHPTWRLDFDHRPGEVKTLEVSKMPTAGLSTQRILDEVAKCDLVCANCHRDRTHFRKLPSN